MPLSLLIELSSYLSFERIISAFAFAYQLGIIYITINCLEEVSTL